jgi:hypothetical protein
MSPRTDVEAKIHQVIDERVRSTPARTPDLHALVQRGRHRRALHSCAAVVAVVGVVGLIMNLAGIGLRGDQDNGKNSPIGAGTAAVVTGGAKGPVAVDAPSRVFVTQNRMYLDGRSHAARAPWDGDQSGDLPPASAPARDKVQPASTSSIHLARDGILFPGTANRPMLLRRGGALVPLAARRSPVRSTPTGSLPTPDPAWSSGPRWARPRCGSSPTTPAGAP